MFGDVEPDPTSIAPTDSLDDLKREWNKVMVSIYNRAKSEIGYNARYYIQMVSNRGGLDTAKYLLHTEKPSEGFTHLWKEGRLDLTVEAHVLDPNFDALFDSNDRSVARYRLEQYGYKFGA